MNKLTARLNIIRTFVHLSPFGVPKVLLMMTLHKLRIPYHGRLKIRGRSIIFPSGSELYLIKQILDDRIYDVDVRDPRRIVDLGANIGIATIFFALKYPNAHIDAYEPSPVAYQ